VDPLTAHRRLWFIECFKPGGGADSSIAALRLVGRLNVVALRQLLGPLDLAFTDLTDLDEADREQAALEVVRAERARPFDLSGASRLRARLLRLGHEEHVLALTAQRCRNPPVVGTGPGAEIPERQLAYWRAQLAGCPTVLQLPTDRSRPPTQTFNGAAVPFHLPAQLTRALIQLGQREQASLYLTLLTGTTGAVGRWRPSRAGASVRAAEAADPQGRRWPRAKANDDATVVYLVLSDHGQVWLQQVMSLGEGLIEGRGGIRPSRAAVPASLRTPGRRRPLAASWPRR
jgi:hypothetical protein